MLTSFLNIIITTMKLILSIYIQALSLMIAALGYVVAFCFNVVGMLVAALIGIIVLLSAVINYYIDQLIASSLVKKLGAAKDRCKTSVKRFLTWMVSFFKKEEQSSASRATGSAFNRAATMAAEH